MIESNNRVLILLLFLERRNGCCVCVRIDFCGTVSVAQLNNHFGNFNNPANTRARDTHQIANDEILLSGYDYVGCVTGAHTIRCVLFGFVFVRVRISEEAMRR